MKFLRLAFLLLLGGFHATSPAAPGDPAPTDRPRLQIINGSAQTVDVFWLRSVTERVPHGSVAPGAIGRSRITGGGGTGRVKPAQDKEEGEAEEFHDFPAGSAGRGPLRPGERKTPRMASPAAGAIRTPRSRW